LAIAVGRGFGAQLLPDDERLAIERHVREIDRLGEDLKIVERDLAQAAIGSEPVKRLMTIPGIDMIVAEGLMAAIGDPTRFSCPQKLVSYLGLNPSVHQSGPGPAHHGRITKQGRGHARGMLVEAAWAAARSPGPLRAFFMRMRAKRGQHIAAVAVARKLAVIAWHVLTKRQNYAWARPALHAQKLRDAELKAACPAGAVRKVRQRPTTSSPSVSRSDAGSSKPNKLTPGSSRVGCPVAPRCARAPQTRSGDHEAARQGLHPHTLLLATRSPVRRKKIARLP